MALEGDENGRKWEEKGDEAISIHIWLGHCQLVCSIPHFQSTRENSPQTGNPAQKRNYTPVNKRLSESSRSHDKRT